MSGCCSVWPRSTLCDALLAGLAPISRPPGVFRRNEKVLNCCSGGRVSGSIEASTPGPKSLDGTSSGEGVRHAFRTSPDPPYGRSRDVSASPPKTPVLLPEGDGVCARDRLWLEVGELERPELRNGAAGGEAGVRFGVASRSAVSRASDNASFPIRRRLCCAALAPPPVC